MMIGLSTDELGPKKTPQYTSWDELNHYHFQHVPTIESSDSVNIYTSHIYIFYKSSNAFKCNIKTGTIKKTRKMHHYASPLHHPFHVWLPGKWKHNWHPCTSGISEWKPTPVGPTLQHGNKSLYNPPGQIITSWWLNHPFEKYARQNGNLPQIGVNMNKHMKPPPR